MNTLKQAKVVSWILGVFFILSFVSDFLKELKILPNGWELPVILGALIVIIQMLTASYSVDQKTEKILERLGSANTMRYDRYSELYNDLAIAVSQAQRSLLLTHIRHEPPSTFKLGQKYFDSIESWCSSHPDGVVKRITTDSNNEMKMWIAEQIKLSEKYPNFYVRICHWNASFPMINMAILDDRKVFLTITGDTPESTAGIQIDDPSIAKYFKEYFDNLWAKSRVPKET